MSTKTLSWSTQSLGDLIRSSQQSWSRLFNEVISSFSILSWLDIGVIRCHGDVACNCIVLLEYAATCKEDAND